jgi:UDPglucose 6-dehydrogenase
MIKLSVVGMGKLGSCMAACFASRGLPVIGVDINLLAVEMINAGQAPVFEPGLAARIAEAGPRLHATMSFEEAIEASDATFIVVPTPSESHGGFSLRHVHQAARDIGKALRRKEGYHLVVLTSTVLPGSTQFGLVPLLERESRRRLGKDLGVCYCPEFIALGTVIRDFLSPDFLLIGESDKRAGDLLVEIYQQACENRPTVARMNFSNAELTKLSVNSFVTMKITFANLLASLCERLPNGDVDVVTSALGLNRRIGGRYLKGGLGYGGPCFPRDNLALAFLARQMNESGALAEVIDLYNRSMVESVLHKVESYLPRRGRVSVLGLSYKPGTVVVEESQGLQAAEALAKRGFRVVVYDPVALANARSVLSERVAYASSAAECVRDADLVIIANPEEEFRTLGASSLAPGKRVVVVDFWRLLRDRLRDNGRIEYVGGGLGRDGAPVGSELQALWGDHQAKAAGAEASSFQVCNP